MTSSNPVRTRHALVRAGAVACSVTFVVLAIAVAPAARAVDRALTTNDQAGVQAVVRTTARELENDEPRAASTTRPGPAGPAAARPLPDRPSRLVALGQAAARVACSFSSRCGVVDTLSAPRPCDGGNASGVTTHASCGDPAPR